MPSRSGGVSDPKDALEQALFSRVVDGDRRALADLYRIYHPRLFKFVFRLTRSYSAAEELVNDTMMAVWEKAGSFRGESRLSTWVFGIAYRQTLRRLSRRKPAIASNIEPDELPGREAGNLEQEDWVRNGIQNLPIAQRLTVLLVFYLGLSYEEIALISDCPVNTVKTRMYHARRKLKAHLATIELPERKGDIG